LQSRFRIPFQALPRGTKHRSLTASSALPGMGPFIFRILRGAIPVGETEFEVLAPRKPREVSYQFNSVAALARCLAMPQSTDRGAARCPDWHWCTLEQGSTVLV